ncbi:hypothetical protein [Catellatospora methionotrophica]|nr:hypothetical protein [Catellatospora methionotrophica]
MDVLFTAIVFALAGGLTGWMLRKRSALWCQECGNPLPRRHRAGEGCHADRPALIAAYATQLAAEPGTRP